MVDKGTYEYRVRQLDKMIAHEADPERGGYGARLSHWWGDTQILTVDAEDLKVLRDYYAKKAAGMEEEEE